MQKIETVVPSLASALAMQMVIETHRMSNYIKQQTQWSEREVQFLTILSEAGSLTARQINKVFALSPSVMSVLVNTLKKSGYIEEVGRDKDKREKLLQLTKLAKNHLRTIQTNLWLCLEESLVGFSAEELDVLAKLEESVRQNLKEKFLPRY